MKYAIVKVVNGNFAVASEHGENKDAAIIAFHQLCASLHNASDVVTSCVKIVDEQLDCVDGYVEVIDRRVMPEE